MSEVDITYTVRVDAKPIHTTPPNCKIALIRGEDPNVVAVVAGDDIEPYLVFIDGSTRPIEPRSVQ